MYIDLHAEPIPISLPRGEDFRAEVLLREQVRVAREAIGSYISGQEPVSEAPTAIRELYMKMTSLLLKYDRGAGTETRELAMMIHKGLHILSALNNFLHCIDPGNEIGRPALPFTARDLREIRRDPPRFGQLVSYTLAQCDEAPAVYAALK